MSAPAWVILPTYCEVGNLEPLVAEVRAAVPEARVLIVDDASPDGTGALAGALAAGDPAVAVLHRLRKSGLGRAYVAGFAHALEAGAGAVVEMDADFSHDPGDLPRLLAALGHADLAVGSRYVDGGAIEAWTPLRRTLSRAGSGLARRVLRVPVRDLTGGFKAFRASALAAIDPASVRSQGYAFQVELTYRALVLGLRVHELPIVFHERRHGQSKMSPRIAAEAAWRVPALRLRRYTF